MGQTSEHAGSEQPVQYLKGVGPRRAADLSRLGIETLGDLVTYFPRDWHDRRVPLDLGSPVECSISVVFGEVLSVKHFRVPSGMAIFQARLSCASGEISAVWFKHASPRYDVLAALKRDVVPGVRIWAVGRCEAGLVGSREIRVDEYYLESDQRAAWHVGRVVPIYGLTDGVGQRFLRELIAAALAVSVPDLGEDLPAELLAKRNLIPYPEAVNRIHFPKSPEDLDAARARLAYEELMLLELGWLLKRRQTKGLDKGYAYHIKRHLLTPFRGRLGFELTGAQKRVINEIFDDLRRPAPMTRLLQGDVGSGKTAVALSALLLAVENGYQGALMAPTEILADQHAATLRRFLAGLPVRIALLTSRLKAKERQSLLTQARQGDIDIVVGTHALLEDDLRLPRLRLSVIDEQHRFGVRQRATLRRKAALMDLLVMTATPIPRTLALALYGDLDVSVLDEMPPGKTRTKTFHASEAEALTALRREVAAGRQAYVVYPLIEESNRVDLLSAKREFERLIAGPLSGLRVSLLHGALSGSKKTAVMREFAEGRCQVLIATSVIEVGIDVPNATVMIVQNADRFGMSSLHQLRGRIGRGELPSTCYLVAEPKTSTAKQRLATLVASNDGFRIGEEDLRLRGPGEFMGMAQHGELSLKIADLFKDAALLSAARQDADHVLREDPRLSRPAHAGLRRRLLTCYGKGWNWVDLA
jgi:ATP-dependent DNA helicase RecG